MNKKLLLNIIGLCVLGLISLNSMQAQGFKMDKHKLSNNYVNADFKVSPNHELLAYSTMFFTESGFDVEVFIHDLKGDSILLKLEHKMMIHSWLDNQHLMLGSEEVNEYFIINIQTMEADTIEGVSDEAVLIKKNEKQTVYFRDNDKVVYYVQNDGTSKEYEQPEFAGSLYYDTNADKIYELHFMNKNKKCYTKVYSYNANKNKRKEIARIRMLTNDEDSYIEHIRAYNGKFYFIESIFTTAIKYKLAFLVSYDIKTKKRKTMYAFEKGLECQNMEVLSDNQFLFLIKDNKKNDNLKEMEIEGSEMGLDFTAEVMLLEKK